MYSLSLGHHQILFVILLTRFNSMIDEETKNELIKRGREQARASFIKKLATSESLSP